MNRTFIFVLLSYIIGCSNSRFIQSKLQKDRSGSSDAVISQNSNETYEVDKQVTNHDQQAKSGESNEEGAIPPVIVTGTYLSCSHHQGSDQVKAVDYYNWSLNLIMTCVII